MIAFYSLRLSFFSSPSRLIGCGVSLAHRVQPEIAAAEESYGT